MEQKNFLENAQDLIPPVNDTQYKRILAIGDVHACFDKLISLWKKISVTADDLVIFLGDYVEGGDQNLNVLRWLMEQNKNEKKEHLKKALAALEISNAALKFYKKLFKTYD